MEKQIDRQQVYEDLSQAIKSLKELARKYHKQGVSEKDLLIIGEQLRTLNNVRLKYVDLSILMNV